MPRWTVGLIIVGAFLCSAASAEDRPARTLRMPAKSVEVVTPSPQVGKKSSDSAAMAHEQRDPLQTRLPSRTRAASAHERAPLKRRTTSTLTVVSSLAVVVGIFLLMAWLSRRAAPQSAQSLPADVVQVLGRAALAPRNAMHLVRVGKKLLLVSLTAQGATTLTEITDPQEVERLLAHCERARPGSISATFRHVLHQFADDRNVTGFLGREREAERPTSSTRA